MGLAACALAVKSSDKAGVLDALRLSDTGQKVSSDDALRGRRVAITVLPNGWIYFLGCRPWADERRMKRGSRLGLAVYCELEEHVMASEVRAYENGVELWAVVHDEDRDLEVRGEPPANFAQIRDAILVKEQGQEIDPDDDGDDPVDYLIEIPLDLAQAVCGLRPDFILEESPPDLEFTLLKRLPEPKPTTPFWRRFMIGLRQARQAVAASRAARR